MHDAKDRLEPVDQRLPLGEIGPRLLGGLIEEGHSALDAAHVQLRLAERK